MTEVRPGNRRRLQLPCSNGPLAALTLQVRVCDSPGEQQEQCHEEEEIFMRAIIELSREFIECFTLDDLYLCSYECFLFVHR